MSPRLLLLLPLVLLWNGATAAQAEEAKPAPGHSGMGEAFDEGPRQFAHLIPGCSAAHFAATTKSPEAQQFIDQGFTQLHGFWYFEAERSFRQAAYLDHDCAIAYLGMALANINNEKRAAGFVKEAMDRASSASPREGRWINMWSAYFNAGKKNTQAKRSTLVKAYEELLFEFPDDLEARAFLLLQLWENSTEGIPLPSRLAVASLAQPILAANPMHPGVHHYLIHLWNSGGTDKQALPDAALCGQSAPGIAHLWHMSGHTYSALHRYDDAAWQQEASARVDHAYMHEARILPEQIHNYAHNNDWLVKDLAYIGRVHDGLELAKNLVELPKLGPGKEAAWHYGRAQIFELSQDFELWEELTALESTPYLVPDTNTARENDRLRALGVAWFMTGQVEKGEATLQALEERLKQARSERTAAADQAQAEAKKSEKSEEDSEKAASTARKGFEGRTKTLENATAELRLARALTAGETAAAKAEFAKISDLSPLRAARVQIALGDFEGAEKRLRGSTLR